MDENGDARLRGLDDMTALVAMVQAQRFLIEVLLAMQMLSGDADAMARGIVESAPNIRGVPLTADPEQARQRHRSVHATLAHIERIVARAREMTEEKPGRPP